MATVVTVVDIKANPNNLSQRYVVYGNGRIDAQGGAVPVVGQATFYDRYDQPVVVAVHILDWATGEGYFLDAWGAFHPLNGAPVITTASGDTFVNNNGLPYVLTRRYVAWSWDPAGTGAGYAVDYYGELYEFGGAPDPVRLGPRWATPSCKAFEMQWSPSKKGYLLDLYGGVWPEWAAATPSPAAPYYAPNDVARDLAITDWTLAKGYTLTADGAVHAFGGAASSLFGGPYIPGADVARQMVVLSPSNPTKFWQVWSGGQSFDYVASDAPTVTAGGSGGNEIQTVTITGTPTGGTFTLTYSGQTTTALARTITAAAMVTALEALSNIGVGDVSVLGAFPAWTVTFQGALGATNVAQMTATSSLTGGTTPAVTVATASPGVEKSPATTVTTTTRPTLAWSYSDPQNDSQAAWELYVFTQTFVDAHTMTDPSVHVASALVAQTGVNRNTRGIESPVDLANGTYRMYIRAKDTAGQWSAWSNRGWTQSISTPTAPTGLTATANNSTYSVALSATTGGTAALVRFEYSDDPLAPISPALVTWTPVRGAGAVTRIATTGGTDYDAPLGLARYYRAVAYSTNPRVASAASSTATATITATGFVLRSVATPTLGGRFYATAPVQWSREVKAGVFWGIDSEFPTVVRDGGGPKSRRGTLQITSLDTATQTMISGLLLSASTLVLRDPLGDVAYCEVVGDWTDEVAKAVAGQPHAVTLPLVEVAPPVTES